MVSVIIPTLNEEKTINDVIGLVGKSSLVSEILVIDDKSLDDTIRKVSRRNVKVYTSTKLGKGASMRDGMLLAKNEVLVYLDADIPGYREDIIELLAGPLVEGSADFVKSRFERQAGRVTELVAKPLLSILFPDLTRFSQPLSGMIGGKKSLFSKIEFENDYGVDIGILIDMYNLGVKIQEVNIGYIENRMQSWEALGKMSREVSRAILKRARLAPAVSLETFENLNIVRTQMDYAIRESLKGYRKMILFDMDNTLLEGSFITKAADEFGFSEALIRIVTENSNSYTRTKLIATLLKNRSIDEILGVADKIRVVFDAGEVIDELRSRGYICGIISDSYDVVSNHLKNKLGLDFSIANELEFSRSMATGEVKVPSYFFRTSDSKCNHDLCKANVVRHLSREYVIDMKNIIGIGDSENDLCMVKECGTGIAFCSENSYLKLVADLTITEKSFRKLLEFAV